MIERNTTTHCVVHCADTPAEMDIGATEIRRWHTEERKWDDIGYHYVIRSSWNEWKEFRNLSCW